MVLNPIPNGALAFSQNLSARVLWKFPQALDAYGFPCDFYTRQNRGHIVFHRQGTLKPLFRAFYMVCPSAWFLRHKPRNVLILRSVLDHSGTLSGAEWVGLYFRLHKAHRQNPSFFGTFFWGFCR